MVQQIVSVDAEVHPQALPPYGRLENRSIQIEEPRPAKGVSWKISQVGLSSRGGELACREARSGDSRTPTFRAHMRIEDIRQYGFTDRSRQPLDAAVCDAEWSSRVIAQAASSGPPADGRIQP